MGNASAEPQFSSFSDATCQRLTQLLLRCLALDNDGSAPSWAIEELRELGRSDATFAAWCSKHVPPLAHSLTGEGTSDSLRAYSIVYELPRQLVLKNWQCRLFAESQPHAESSQPTSDAEWSSLTQRDAAARAESILLELASLAIRLHGFQSQFTRELEVRFQQSLYNFAYGLSHELNNPLANIATRAGVLAQDETSQHRRSLLHAIVDNAMRGCEMLGDLMLVARPPLIERRPVAIIPFLETLVEKAKKWVEQRAVMVELQIQESPPDGQAVFDPQAMTETLWCLLRNGVEAMPAGGRLTICTTYRVDLKHDRFSNSWWVIQITDEGMGMSQAALDNCFDPFYSGREAGRGLGVGLTKAQRLVSLHHGRLTLANRTDRAGCRAVIELPSELLAESPVKESPK